MTSLLTRFRAHVAESGFFDQPGTALVAVSGGGDSLALLDLMRWVADDFGLRLGVAHVDHGIRPDSERVADRVSALAGRLGLRSRVVSLGMGKGTSETEARAARYDGLFAVSKELGARYLVMGHHADDQAETVLFRVLRGSGMAGLAGMSAQRTDGLVRPLLPFRRRDLEEWLDRAGLGPEVHHDPENRDPRHDRAWIRTELMPSIRGRFGPEAEERLLDVARHAGADRAAWAALIRTLPGLGFRTTAGGVTVARRELLGYDKPLSQAILRAVALEAGCVIGPSRMARMHALLLSSQSGRRFEVGNGWECEVVFDRLAVRRAVSVPIPEPATWGNLERGRVDWGPWIIYWKTEPAGKVVREGWTTWVTPGSGIVRGWEAGDRIRPVGGVGRRKVARLLMEAGVPRRERRRVPIISRGAEILWVPGVCRAEQARAQPGVGAVRLDVRDARS